MTNPKSTAERLDAIELRLSQLVSPGSITDTTARVAALELRLTVVEQLLAQKIPGFEAVGARVSELSAGFLAANGRFTAIEQAIEALTTAAPPPGAERLAALETALVTLSGTVSTLQATRGRTGLSGRLRSIEEKLDALVPPTPGG
jgi:hypothetical protein